MAAISAPYGLRPVKTLGSQDFNGGQESYPIASGFATGLFYGSPVILGATGNIELAPLGFLGYVGIFVGCTYEDPTFGPIHRQFWPAGTITKDAAPGTAFVADDPDLTMAVQCTVANFNALANLGRRLTLSLPAPPAHGNIATGNSRAGCTATVSATGEFLLMSILNRPDNINGSGFVDMVGVIANGLHIARRT